MDSVLNQLAPGNINKHNRPRVQMPDGSIATVRTITVSFEGPDGIEHVLLPTIGPKGEDWSDDEAVRHYINTGQHFGKFTSLEAAENASQWLHLEQEMEYLK